MESSVNTKFYTKGEEMANTLSHGAGILLGGLVGYLLLNVTVQSGDFWKTFSVCLYLFGMLGSYITSTFYHAYPHGQRKELLRKFDHAAIYFHIAGTYAPFTLITLRTVGIWGWALFTFIYIAAFAGLFMSFRKLKKHSNIETVCFVVMGLCILVALKPLSDALGVVGQSDALYWLIGGGVSYIVGALFYSLTKVRYMHFIFHLFVLGGSICHLVAIYKIL